MFEIFKYVFSKSVRHFEEMIRVLFVINPFCCHGDCNIFVISSMKEESAVTDHMKE